MATYNVNTAWDDPFEHLKERRVSDRFAAELRISIEAKDVTRRGRLVGPGLLRDLSLSGASLVTKHAIDVHDHVTVQFDASDCSEGAYFPDTFTGEAVVVRVDRVKGSKRALALRFGEAFTQSMDFALYVDHLRMSSDREAMAN
jgi:hypothetical protein